MILSAQETSATLDPKRIRKMPAQKPGRSKQDYGTPPEFIEAVKIRFGIREFYYDLAASEENSKGRFHFCEEEDSLKQDWTKLGDKQLWLNPVFSNIAPYAEKCAAFADAAHSERSVQRTVPTKRGGCIYFLTPASIGANWFADHVYKKARVIALQGRLSFDGIAPYPKDCMLSCFGLPPGFEVWDWRQEKNNPMTAIKRPVRS